MCGLAKRKSRSQFYVVINKGQVKLMALKTLKLSALGRGLNCQGKESTLKCIA